MVLFQVPFTVMKQITNKANTILNGIGGKVTGL